MAWSNAFITEDYYFSPPNPLSMGTTLSIGGAMYDTATKTLQGNGRFETTDGSTWSSATVAPASGGYYSYGYVELPSEGVSGHIFLRGHNDAGGVAIAYHQTDYCVDAGDVTWHYITTPTEWATYGLWTQTFVVKDGYLYFTVYGIPSDHSATNYQYKTEVYKIAASALVGSTPTAPTRVYVTPYVTINGYELVSCEASIVLMSNGSYLMLHRSHPRGDWTTSMIGCITIQTSADLETWSARTWVAEGASVSPYVAPDGTIYFATNRRDNYKGLYTSGALLEGENWLFSSTDNAANWSHVEAADTAIYKYGSPQLAAFDGDLFMFNMVGKSDSTYNLDGISMTVGTDLALPEPPYSVTATLTATGAQVCWSHDGGANGFVVERQVDGGAWTQVYP